MSDVAPRIEVGILNFELISGPIPGEHVIDLGDRFGAEVRAAKLSMRESGVLADSGIVDSDERSEF
jgi:hypothetical protein